MAPRGVPGADNPRTLEHFGQVPVLAQLPPLEPLSAEALANCWREQDLTSKFQQVLEQTAP